MPSAQLVGPARGQSEVTQRSYITPVKQKSVHPRFFRCCDDKAIEVSRQLNLLCPFFAPSDKKISLMGTGVVGVVLFCCLSVGCCVLTTPWSPLGEPTLRIGNYKHLLLDMV